ncbi:MAG TPA: peptidase M20, partial [Thermoanaerobaculia bacterium]|nr:peptidase M20 [Thermoanaerobaculia bacterium]
MRLRLPLLLIPFLLLFVAPVQAAVPPLDDSTRQLIRDIYKQLVEINTTDSIGNTTTAAEAMAARLKAAGFPERDLQVLGPNPRKGNLVARLHGSGQQKPLLLLAHLDVVEAKR